MSRTRYTAALAAVAIAIPLTVAAGGAAHAAPAPVAKSSVSMLLAPGVTRASWGGMSIIKISQSLNSFQFVPGTSGPGGYNSKYDGGSTYRTRMTAAFNGGFLLNSDAGGYALRGKVYKSLQSGYGSLVVDKAGHLDVVKWQSWMSASNYRVVRQNLPLLVDNGSNKTSSRGNGCDSWGAVGAQYRHCPGERSAVGVTSSGQVVYVYGYRVYANDLARALIHFGVKRGMVLEMNQAWPRAYTYSKPGGSASILNGNMSSVDGAYKYGYKRDFIVAKNR